MTTEEWNDRRIPGADHHLLSLDEETALVVRVAAGDVAARNTLLEHNLKLVIKIAQRYEGRGLDLQDLVQEGCLGLITAAERFNPERKLRFSTYATWWVRQAISRACMNYGRSIRLPVHLHEHVAEAHKKAASLTVELGREPTDAEIADALGWDVKTLHRRRTAALSTYCISLDAPLDAPLTVNHLDDRDRLNLIADPNVDVEAEALANTDQALVARLLRRLPKRQRQILAWRHGIGGDGPYTLEQIGHKLDLTRERVRQLEADALKALREALGTIEVASAA